MPKLDVNELKALLAEAEEKGEEDVDLSHVLPDEDSSDDESLLRRGSLASEGSGRKSQRSTAIMTRELTDLYRQAIAQTADGSLGYEDIKALVTSFAEMEPSDAQMKGIMAELDEDGDGDVTESEWVNFGLKQLGAYVSADMVDDNGNQTVNLSLLESYRVWWNEIDWEDLYFYVKETAKYALEDAKVSFTFDDIMMAMTFFVLFADNIKLLAAPKTDDFAFDVVNSIILFSFIVELVMNSWAKTTFTSTDPRNLKYDGYFLSFYWCLDLLSIISMFPDITWIAEGLHIGELTNTVQGNNSITGIGKIIRLVRLVRLVRLYKLFMEKRKRMRLEKELFEQVRRGDITYDDVERQKALHQERQSKLGSILSESIVQRVIVLVLIMVIIMPVITYSETNYVASTATDILHQINANASMSSTLKASLVSEVVGVMNSDLNPEMVYLYMSPYDSSAPLINMVARQESLRKVATLTIELGSTSLNDDYSAYTKAVFDGNVLVRRAASLNIGMTIFVGTVLVLAAGVFNSDAQDTVLSPIERMMNMLEEIVKDPLQPLSFDHSNPAGPGEYETRLLENTVEKITGLLRVGFGEAGAGIISSNLSLDSGRKVNPLLPGVKVYVIVGFCDIHHFEDVLVKLTDDVLTFVNTIAEIVHENVAHWGGQCNKNLGNAFVILWRIDDEERLHAALNTSKFSKKTAASGEEVDRASSKRSRNRDNNEERSKEIKVDLRRVPGINFVADQALIGYLKIIAEINRNKSVLKYRNEPRLTHNGAESFKVSMGFGLHAGWAIEGAVGSLYKVDATYLSPHVNMAARLETSSRQYGVPLLASQDVYDLFSHEVQKLCRRVDVVTVKGSAHEIGIYTYDCLEDQAFRSKPDNGDGGKKKDKQMPGVNTGGTYELEDVKVVMASEAAARVSKQGKYMQVMAPLDVDYAPGFLASNQSTTVKSSKGGAQKQSAKLLDKKDDDEIQEGFFLTNASDTVDVFEMDDDLLMLRAHVKDDFITNFEEGIKVYLEGDWPAARNLLEQANKLMADAAPSMDGDGPCLTLLAYMEARKWKAPDDWQGFRPLTSK